MAKTGKNKEEDESWSISKYAKSEFNGKSKKKIAAPVAPDFSHQIACVVEMHEDHNPEGDFAITLQFQGISFPGDVVASHSNERTRRSYHIPVSYISSDKESFLLLTTIGDIFEYEVVRDIKQCCLGECLMEHIRKRTAETGEKEFCPNRLFRDEAYIPKLLEAYDSLTMQVELKNNRVIVTYKRLV